MRVSGHAFSRGQQRSIPEQVIELVFEYGEVSPKPGGAVELYMSTAVADARVAKLKRQIADIDPALMGQGHDLVAKSARTRNRIGVFTVDGGCGGHLLALSCVRAKPCLSASFTPQFRTDYG